MLPTTKLSRPVLILLVLATCFVTISLLTPHRYTPHSFPSFVYPYKSSSPNRPLPPLPYHDDSTYPAITPSPPPPPSLPGSPRPHLENATFFMLTTNSESDIRGALQSVRELEDRFNHKYNYPWIFLNDVPFSDEFKSRISVLVSGPVHFAEIPASDWNHPPWLNETRVMEEVNNMSSIPRGDSLSYHNMCRFNSGFYYRHPLLQNYRYSWRVEPEVHFHCDINFDAFTFMRENNKAFSFNIAMYEYPPTIPSLWPTVKEFIMQHPEYVAPDPAIEFLSDDGGIKHNHCTFYNNFEIADMDFWRGEAFSAYFDYLDHHGGFYYERWGDANVHTMGAALFAGTDRIHFFDEIGYTHYEFTHCPTGDVWERGKCTCDPNPERNVDYSGISCLPKWEQLVGRRQVEAESV